MQFVLVGGDHGLVFGVDAELPAAYVCREGGVATFAGQAVGTLFAGDIGIVFETHVCWRSGRGAWKKKKEREKEEEDMSRVRDERGAWSPLLYTTQASQAPQARPSNSTKQPLVVNHVTDLTCAVSVGEHATAVIPPQIGVHHRFEEWFGARQIPESIAFEVTSGSPAPVHKGHGVR